MLTGDLASLGSLWAASGQKHLLPWAEDEQGRLSPVPVAEGQDAVPQLEPPHRPWERWWSLLHLVAGEKANGVWGGETTLRPGRALFTSKRELSFQIRA